MGSFILINLLAFLLSSLIMVYHRQKVLVLDNFDLKLKVVFIHLRIIQRS